MRKYLFAFVVAAVSFCAGSAEAQSGGFDGEWQGQGPPVNGWCFSPITMNLVVDHAAIRGTVEGNGSGGVTWKVHGSVAADGSFRGEALGFPFSGQFTGDRFIADIHTQCGVFRHVIGGRRPGPAHW